MAVVFKERPTLSEETLYPFLTGESVMSGEEAVESGRNGSGICSRNCSVRRECLTHLSFKCRKSLGFCGYIFLLIRLEVFLLIWLM